MEIHESKLTNKELSEDELLAWQEVYKKFLNPQLVEKLENATSSSAHLVPFLGAEVELDADGNPNGNIILKNKLIHKVRTSLDWVREHRDKFFNKRQPKDELISLVNSLTEGLIVLHQNNLVHGDVNTSNFFITDPNNPIGSLALGDYELVQENGQSNRYFESFMGTTGFTPMDQRKRDWVFYPSMDQFALAFTLVEILSGGEINPRLINLGEKVESIDDDITTWSDKDLNFFSYAYISDVYGRNMANIFARALKLPDEKKIVSLDRKDFSGRYGSIIEFRDALLEEIGKLPN